MNAGSAGEVGVRFLYYLWAILIFFVPSFCSPDRWLLKVGRVRWIDRLDECDERRGWDHII